ncbi:MAG TPA: hypothetical protein VH328_06725 [Burkholderiaceae bacterium]|jgi:hypothetical protein|nr:hypothetical protein [Burkholderiaceae bacterium]
MLEAVRRWLARGHGLPAWDEVATWARANGWTLRRTLSQEGWVMDRHPERPRWRIEWGPSQRAFMSSHELRIRVETKARPEVQALVLDRALLARLDREVYQQYTDSVQTRLDAETPEEMRWLAMHTKLAPNDMGASLRDRYGGVSSDPPWLVRWLPGPVSDALVALAKVMPIRAVAAEPFILRLSPGRIVLRQAAPVPRLRVLEGCVTVVDAAQASVERSVGSP